MRLTLAKRGVVVCLLCLVGCGPSTGDSKPDSGSPVVDDGGPADSGATVDAGSAFDPTAVHWNAMEEPAEGPLTVWGHVVARIDEHRAVLFGGTSRGPTSGGMLGGTWLYDGSGERLSVTELADDGPAPRYCACAAWDAARERVVLTGGRDLSGPVAVPPETWELDLDEGEWTQIEVPESPPGVIGCMMAYSESADRTYVFGGGNLSGTRDVIYRYDPETPAWVELEARGPSPRYDGVLIPIEGGAQLLLVGGALAGMGAGFYSDIWRFDTESESWSELPMDGPTPPGRRVPWMAPSPDGQGYYVAMGFDGSMQPISDFWYLSLEQQTWSELSLPEGLTARGFTQWLPGTDGSLGTMIGGYDAMRPVREAWQLVAD